MTLRLCPSTIARGRSARCCASGYVGAERAREKARIMGFCCGMNDHFHWRDAEIASAVANIVQQSPDVHWQIWIHPSSQGLVARLRQRWLTRCAPNARVLRYTDNPSDWLTQALASASQVWVSADSASMLYEALSSGGQVGVIELTSKRRRNKLQAGIDALHRQRRVGLSTAGTLPGQDLEPEPLQGTFAVPGGFLNAGTVGASSTRRRH